MHLQYLETVPREIGEELLRRSASEVLPVRVPAKPRRILGEKRGSVARLIAHHDSVALRGTRHHPRQLRKPKLADVQRWIETQARPLG
jgi:hypothetical protein